MEIGELANQLNLLKAENSSLVASLEDALDRIQKLETQIKEPALFPISEAREIAEILGPLNQETSITWMLQIANSLPPSLVNGYHLTQIARLCMCPVDQNKLEAAVMFRNLLSSDMYSWMDNVINLLWPGLVAYDLYYRQKQHTNEDPEVYLARKKLLAKMIFPPEKMEKEFIHDLHEGLHPKSMEYIDSLTGRKYSWLRDFQKLRSLTDKFRVTLAKRQEKALARKRENKKKSREGSPRERLSDPPKKPTPQREMETSEDPNFPRKKSPGTPKRVHSPRPETSSCPTKFRSHQSPYQKENSPLIAAVRTTVRKQKGNSYIPHEHPETKKFRTPGNRAWSQSEGPQPKKLPQPSILEKGNPRDHPSHPRGMHWNGTGRFLPRRGSLERTAGVGNTLSASTQPLDLEVRHTVSASKPESPEDKMRKGILETAL